MVFCFVATQTPGIASLARRIKNPQFDFNPNTDCQVGQLASSCYQMGHLNVLGIEQLTIRDLLSQEDSRQKFEIEILIDSENLPHGFDQNSLQDYCYLMYKDSLNGDCGQQVYPNSDPILMGVIGYVAQNLTINSLVTLSQYSQYLNYIPDNIHQKIKSNKPITFQDLREYDSTESLYNLIFDKLETYQFSDLLSGYYQVRLTEEEEINAQDIFQVVKLEKLFLNNPEIYQLANKTIDTFLYKNPNYELTTFGDLLNVEGNQLGNKRLYDVFGQTSFFKQINSSKTNRKKNKELRKSPILLANNEEENNAANKLIDEIPGMAEYALNGLAAVQNAEILAALVIYQTQYRLKEMLNGQIPNIPLVRFDLPYIEENYAHNTISGGYNWQVSGAYHCDNNVAPPPKQDLRGSKQCSHLELLSLLDLGILNKGTGGTQWVAGDEQWVEGGLGILRILFGKYEPTGIPLPTESFYQDMANGDFDKITGMDVGDAGANLSEEDKASLEKAQSLFMGEMSWEQLVSGMDAQELASIESQIGSDQFNEIKSMFGSGNGLTNETIYAKITMRDLNEDEGSAMLSLAFGWCQRIFFYKTCTPRFIHLPGLIKFEEDSFIPLPMPIK